MRDQRTSRITHHVSRQNPTRSQRALRITIGRCVQDLELIAKAGEPEEMANRVEYLPL